VCVRINNTYSVVGPTVQNRIPVQTHPWMLVETNNSCHWVWILLRLYT